MLRGRRFSRHGARFIAKFEGFSSTPYRDPVGVWTIGYGTTDGVGPGTRPISRRKALRLLRRDARIAARAVRRVVKVKLTQNQFDALVSFTYNVGVGAFQSSTLLRLLNEGRYHQAADEFLRWDFGGGQQLAGLTRRRRAERRLFKTKRRSRK